MQVLLVEDNRINQIVAGQMLKIIGIESVVAGTGEDALESLRKNRFELVLMDIQLPGLSGIEVTRIIRDPDSDVLDHDVPIIALTAYASEEDRLRCLECGMNNHLSKPLRMNDLLDTVTAYVNIDSGKEEASLPDKPRTETPVSENPQPDMSQLPVFDREELMLRIGNDEELARDIVEGFLGRLDRYYQEIKDALSTDDPDMIHRRAHGLAGAAGNISAVALRQAAKEIEKTGREGRVDDARSLMEHLHSVLEETRTVLSSQKFSGSG
jgi:CheY-like chemotaxis protein